ncbi:hypothetical protein NPIL_126351 [Nephila pilipes]|uniref:Uncharacterized protein n=1 Tax=Nephila pilipes TaxID=299642 RepID=A0A8X6N5Y4_NEPPI|nr:hypothetical protein NPIL_126351 [Nephila pilipes]
MVTSVTSVNFRQLNIQSLFPTHVQDCINSYKEVISKTDVTTPFGLFIPFGLSNAPIFHYLIMCLWYPQTRQNTQDYHHVFLRFSEYAIQLNTDKRIFAPSSMSFLGHITTSFGVSPHL